jgi:CBS domain-containing protein
MRRIADIMSGRPRVTLSPGSSAMLASRTMCEHQVGAVMIVNEEDVPLGVFTERDLMTRVVVPGLNPAQVTLARIMTRDVFVATLDQSIDQVAEEMAARHIRHLPVVDQNRRFVGMISQRDVLRELLNEANGQVHDLETYIRGVEEGR